jgi:hypothetical protein
VYYLKAVESVGFFLGEDGRGWLILKTHISIRSSLNLNFCLVMKSEKRPMKSSMRSATVWTKKPREWDKKETENDDDCGNTLMMS